MSRRVLRDSLLWAGYLSAVSGLIAWRFRVPDPRGTALVQECRQRAEHDDFRERLRRGGGATFVWPGLAAMQVSWNWMQMLSSLHDPESYKGDFSWMFSKLKTIVDAAPPSELAFIAGLAPYYFVIGHDYAGATLIMNELVRRANGHWQAWFWSGYHALDNLKNPRLAGDLMRHAAMVPGSPDFVAALSVRLSKGEAFIRSSEKRAMLERELPPEMLEKIRKSRPEWFQN